MPRELATSPPRPIAAGDVVACFSDDLGEWTAAQLTDLNPSSKTVGVLELDWSGSEPESVSDLGYMSPLVLNHHAWPGQLSHVNYPWILPRSFKVIGSMPLLKAAESQSYSTGWQVGMQLALQRQWDRGDRDSSGRPGELKLTGPGFIDYAAGETSLGVWSLAIENVAVLDCRRLIQIFPQLRRLMLRGSLGSVDNASQLNQLRSLKMLAITDLFGMTKSDCLFPEAVPTLEWLALHSVPREYGGAMRSVWAPEVAKGCLVAITALRSPEWLAENLDNPLRDWDGREHISSAKFRKSVAQYKATRRAVLAALADSTPVDLRARLVEIGREYGDAFNELAKRADFIETEEREELFAALTAIPTQADLRCEVDAKEAGEWLSQGLEEVRDW